MPITTDQMGLVLPDVGATGTLGPEWASRLNTALETVDNHDHTTGRGARIPTAGISIDADLDFNSSAATDVSHVKFVNLSASLTGASNARELFVTGSELYFNSQGTAVKITSNGALNNAGLGGIGGDYSSADALVTYDDFNKKYITYQGPSSGQKAAIWETGGLRIRATGSADTNVIHLRSTSSLPASYNLTLPVTQPSGVLMVDGIGQMTGTLSPVLNDVLTSVTRSFTIPASAFNMFTSASSPIYWHGISTSYLQFTATGQTCVAPIMLEEGDRIVGASVRAKNNTAPTSGSFIVYFQFRNVVGSSFTWTTITHANTSGDVSVTFPTPLRIASSASYEVAVAGSVVSAGLPEFYSVTLKKDRVG